MMAKIWTKHSKPPLNIPKPGGETRHICGKETHKLSAKPLCEQVQLLLAAKMRIFCRLPRAGYQTADDTDLYAPLNDAYHVQVAEQGTQVPAAR